MKSRKHYAGVIFFCAAIATAQQLDLVAHDAWAAPPASSRNMTGLFLVLENHSGEKRAVVSGSSEAAETLEFHEMKTSGGMMRMSPVSQIEVPAHGKTELKPGALHIMMFGLKGKPTEGGTFTVNLKLDNGTTLPVKATFRRPRTE